MGADSVGAVDGCCVVGDWVIVVVLVELVIFDDTQSVTNKHCNKLT